MLESAFPTHKGQNLKPKMGERSEQRPTNKAKNIDRQHSQWMNWKNTYSQNKKTEIQDQLGLSSEWSRKCKNFPSLFLITEPDFYEFGAWIYTTIVAERKPWIFSLNWFQLGDTFRYLTEANSNLLWKKILLNGASMNSNTLSYKENKTFFFFKKSVNAQGNKPPWVRVGWNKKL